MSWTLVVLLFYSSVGYNGSVVSVALPNITDEASCVAAGRKIIASSWANKERSTFTCTQVRPTR